MARFISPITDMKPNGSLRFFKSGTNTELITYKDQLETIQNPTIVPVLPNGNVENVFFSGSAKVLYLDEFDQQYAERDPVGGEKELGDFTLWDSVVTYNFNDIVEGSDFNFYISLSNNNIGNDPVSTPTSWTEIRFLEVWNTNVTYAIGDIVQTTNGDLWKAVSSSSFQDPSTDDGSNWLPAINSEKSPETITLELRTTTVIPQTGGGELTALRENELRDGNTGYTIPRADSVLENQIIKISQPARYVQDTPLVTVSSGDTLNNGTVDPDGEILFNNNSGVSLTLTSDGISNWSL